MLLSNSNNQITLSSPECLVNNDNVNNDDVQQMWQWTADHDQGKVLQLHYGQFPSVVILFGRFNRKQIVWQWLEGSWHLFLWLKFDTGVCLKRN